MAAAAPEPDLPETLEDSDYWKEQTKQMRERSGTVTDDRPLVAFLYELLRDHLPTGDVEQLVRRSMLATNAVYTNGYLANYAQDLAARLLQDAAPPTS